MSHPVKSQDFDEDSPQMETLPGMSIMIQINSQKHNCIRPGSPKKYIYFGMKDKKLYCIYQDMPMLYIEHILVKYKRHILLE